MKSLWLVCIALFAWLNLCSLARAERSTSAPGDSEVAGVGVARDTDEWHAKFRRLNELPNRDRCQLVFLGDALTETWGDAGREAWNRFYAHRRAINLGIAGDCSDHVLWRIEHGNLKGMQPKLVVVHFGFNDLANSGDAQQTVDGISAIVDCLTDRLPKTQILLLGVFPQGAEQNQPLRLQIAEANRLLSHVADWEQVHFLDIGHEFLKPDGTISPQSMPDACHLSPTGYLRWAEAMELKVAELLGDAKQERFDLFDGESLRGWQAGDKEGAPQGWDIVDGTLAVVGRGDDAQTVQKFRNFDFQCEWKVERRTNSGIFYRWADYAGIVSAGPEYQIVDEIGRHRPPDRKDSLAATTDMFEPIAEKPTREPGLWNHSRIVAVGGTVEHWLNGMRVVAFEIASEEWKDRLQKSKFRRLWPFGLLYEGAFRLQNYGGMPVYYRDISVVKL